MNDALKNAKHASLATIRDVIKSVDGNVTSDAARYNDKLAHAHAARADAVMDAYEASKRTDLGFIEKANRAHLEKLMGSMFLDAPGGGGGDENRQTTVQTLELDGTTVTVDRVDPWHPTFDKGGRLEKKADLGAIMGASKEPRRLVVEVLAARNIEATDLLGTSDPYAVVSLGAQLCKTAVRPRTLKPVWAERFNIIAAKALETDEVDVSLYDHDMVGSHDFLGRIGIPVSSIEEGGGGRTHAHWVKLRSARPPPAPYLGTCYLSAYHDADVPGRLRVYVLGARDVPVADITGTSDPYVRVSLLRIGEQGGGHKNDDARRTRVRSKTLEPVWAQGFTFEGVDDRVDVDVNESSLLLELYDHDLVGADDALAQLVLPLSQLPKARDGDRASAPVEHEWREHTKKRKVSGELNLICYWEDRRKTRLCVRVARAVDVKAADVEGTSDPYVVGTLRAGVKGVQGREDQVYRTKTVKATLNPTWNHNFHFRVFPSTEKQIRASQTSRRGVIGTIMNVAFGDPAVKAAKRAKAKANKEKKRAEAAADADRRRRLGVKKGSSFFGGVATAFHGGDGFKTDVKARALAREKAIDLEKIMVSSLGGDPHGAFNEDDVDEDPDDPGADSGVIDVRGQILELDLYDADEGVFQGKDDFLGRILLPLEQVATIAEGGDRHSLWMPWREKKSRPVKGEVCVRCYFPDATPVLPEDVPEDLADRLGTQEEQREELKLQRVKEQAWALFQELEGQLRMQLLCQKWPAEIAAKYARAYARHGHEHRLIPPPPDGCTVPASFQHMFETAEKAARAYNPPARPEFPMANHLVDEEDPANEDAEKRDEEGTTSEENTSKIPPIDPEERARVYPPVPTYSAATKEVEQRDYERMLQDFPELADAEAVARVRGGLEKERLRGVARRGWAVARKVMESKKRELQRKDAIADNLLGMVQMARENEAMQAEINRVKAQMAVFDTLRNKESFEGTDRLTKSQVAPYKGQGYERRAALATARTEDAKTAEAERLRQTQRRRERETEREKRRAPWSSAVDTGPAAYYMSTGESFTARPGLPPPSSVGQRVGQQRTTDPSLPAHTRSLADKLAGSAWAGFFGSRERSMNDAVLGSIPARGVGASAARHKKDAAKTATMNDGGGNHGFHGPPPPRRPANALATAMFRRTDEVEVPADDDDVPADHAFGHRGRRDSDGSSRAPTWERESGSGGSDREEPPALPADREAAVAKLLGEVGLTRRMDPNFGLNKTSEPSLSKFGPRHPSNRQGAGSSSRVVVRREPLVPVLDLNALGGVGVGGDENVREPSRSFPGRNPPEGTSGVTEKRRDLATKIRVVDGDDDDDESDRDGPVPKLDLRGVMNAGGHGDAGRVEEPSGGGWNMDLNPSLRSSNKGPSRLQRTTTVRARIAADWDLDS